MALLTAAYVLAAVMITSTVSGTLGMAGGLMLMGALALVMPPAPALALHGLVQMGSNGWRVIIHRHHVRWRVVAIYAAGAVVAMAAFSLVAFSPSKLFIYLVLGLIPVVVWLPQRWIRLDAARPSHAFVSGLTSTVVSLTAGVSGPLNDLFFINTDMSRHQVVATKASVQVFGHLSKVLFYGASLLVVTGQGAPPLWLPAAALPVSMIGAVLGAVVLDRLSDQRFRQIRRWLVTALGLVYLVQAAQLFARGT